MPSSKLPPIEVAHRSDAGRDPTKQVNEDALGYRAARFGHLAVVCDGMGGHDGGKEASERALQTIFEAFAAHEANPEAAPPPREILGEALRLANARVYELGGPATNDARPGSTVVAVLLHEGGTEVAHVGDSRAYLIHLAQITQVTKDHSMVQQMVDAHLLTQEQAASHPAANRISRALGMLEDVEVEVRPSPIAHIGGDAFVLCSDGLSDLVPAEDILRLVGTVPPAEAVKQLVDLANARGGHDNITVLIVRVKEGAAAQQPALTPTVVQTSPDAAGSGTLPPLPLVKRVAPTLDGTSPEEAPRRRISTLVLMGIFLGIVGVTIAAIAIYLFVANPQHGKTPSFAEAGWMPAVKGSSPLVLLVPEPVAPPLEVDAGASDLLPHKPTKRYTPERR